MKYEFFMAIIPPTSTAQEKAVRVIKKDGKHIPIFYDPPELAAAKEKMKAHLSKHAARLQVEKMNGPLRMVTKWCFPITGKHQDGEYKDTKPDTDNLQKALKDIMAELNFFDNDAQVASEIIEKFWAVKPGIFIHIEEI